MGEWTKERDELLAEGLAAIEKMRELTGGAVTLYEFPVAEVRDLRAAWLAARAELNKVCQLIPPSGDLITEEMIALRPLVDRLQPRALNHSENDVYTMDGGLGSGSATRVRGDLRLLHGQVERLTRELAEARAEAERLRAGGCARGQDSTSQFCAEVERLTTENARLRSVYTPDARQVLEAEVERLRGLLAEPSQEEGGRLARLFCAEYLGRTELAPAWVERALRIVLADLRARAEVTRG